MCGRYASAKHDIDLIPEARVASVVGEPPPPSWNIAPTQDARVVLERLAFGADGPADRQLRTLRWGLVPSWAKDVKIGSRMINARAETLAERSAFRAAFARRRCLVPADGYFEWEKRQDADGRERKVPTYLHRDGETLWFAGLYEIWREGGGRGDDADPPAEGGGAGELLWTYTVITTTAPDALGHVHDRSPVLLPPALHDAWLDPRHGDPEAVADLLRSAPEPRLLVREVSPAVNNHRNNGPELVAPVG